MQFFYRKESKNKLIKRHSLTVRITHWINVCCLTILLMSGLQIFNAHPNLYWGEYGAVDDHAILSIGSSQNGHSTKGYLRIGYLNLDTTGILGVSKVNNVDTARSFPDWITLPSWQDLGAGRHWHFTFAWILVINGFIYLIYGFWRRHIQNDLMPARTQLSLKHLFSEIINHVRLRFPRGEEARRYNALQKISYIAVIFILLPVMVLTGLTMSPAIDATFPFLTDLFGGRPSARTLHFIVASMLLIFVIVHLVMVLASGVWNNLRSMITGRYSIKEEEKKE